MSISWRMDTIARVLFYYCVPYIKYNITLKLLMLAMVSTQGSYSFTMVLYFIYWQ